MGLTEIVVILVIPVIVLGLNRQRLKQAVAELKQDRQGLIAFRQTIFFLTVLMSFVAIAFVLNKGASDGQLWALVIVLAAALGAGYYAFIKKD